MRVITGKYRGMSILSPKGDAIRPTTDKVKEDIFNIIRPYIGEDSIFLDLFTGTGAIGIEAVSRGCEKAILVDNSRDSLALAEKNVKKTKEEARFKLSRSDAKAFLLATRDVYDIIFMDAPYAYSYTDELIALIEKRALLSEGGVLAVEIGAKAEAPKCSYELFREKKYAATALYFYIKEN